MPVSGALVRLVGDNALLLFAAASFAIAMTLRLSGQINQDAWLGLVSGRLVWQDGLPREETWTIWGAGHAWVDQQWLAQLGMYGVWSAGGLGLLAAAHAVLTCGAFGAAIAAARRSGATARAVLFVLPCAFWVLIGSTWQVRTQTAAYPLFVGVLWLLVRDARAPSARVLWTLPLLVVWANLHGSVLLGSGLVALAGLVRLAGRRSGCAVPAALVLLAPLAPLVTPYGLDVVGYYRDTAFNPSFSSLLNEWMPLHLGLLTAPYFALAFGTVWLLGRAGGALTAFERLALAVALVGGLSAGRSTGWFALAVIVILPAAIDRAFPSGRPAAPPGAVVAVAAAGAAAVLAILLCVTLARPASWFTAGYPDGAAAAVAREVRSGGGTVWADVKYADWLLWRQPGLAGRLAFDARFEQLPAGRIGQVYAFNDPFGEPWRVPARGHRILVLDESVSARVVREALGDPGARLAWRGAGAAVVVRP